MKVDLSSSNSAMISIIKDPNQIITLDANFIIPPYRKEAQVEINFSKFQTIL